MSDKEKLQRILVLKQQLTLINLYPKEFEKKLGAGGVDDMVDTILDEINRHLKDLGLK